MKEPLQMADKLDLSAASDLMSQLKNRSEDEVVLDFADVKHMGALCLQVLLSAATNAVSENRKIAIVNASDRVVDQLRVMGMTPEMISRGRQ